MIGILVVYAYIFNASWPLDDKRCALLILAVATEIMLEIALLACLARKIGHT